MNKDTFLQSRLADLESFARVSRLVGTPDHVQGGGGNTSVKLEGGYMAIKASGFRLDQITPDNAYAVLDYIAIADFYHTKDAASLGADIEPIGAQVTKDHIVAIDGLPVLRPSVEAGTHALLGKFVLHTHTVYSNLATFAVNMTEVLAAALPGIDYCVVPYIDPGTRLSFAVEKAVKENPAGAGCIFLQNHGFIASADTAEEALILHNKVCDMLVSWFGAQPFPKVSVNPGPEEGIFISDTPYLKERIAAYDDEFLCERSFNPDQLVYLSDKKGKNLQSGVYTASRAEAQALEEILTATVWIVETAKAKGVELQPMNAAAKGFIAGWESEKYRKSMVTK